jgi:ribosomal protein S18 acetylase RimI-like enzyme
MQKFEILSSNLRDLSELRKLEHVCFGDDAWPLIDLIGVLGLPGIIRLKAVVDEKMAGFIAGDPKPWEEQGWITTVGVHPENRQQGIGSALIRECEVQMKMPKVRLSVRQSNINAVLLYEHLGYHQVGIWPKYYRDGEDALVLEKIIS